MRITLNQKTFIEQYCCIALLTQLIHEFLYTFNFDKGACVLRISKQGKPLLWVENHDKDEVGDDDDDNTSGVFSFAHAMHLVFNHQNTVLPDVSRVEIVDQSPDAWIDWFTSLFEEYREMIHFTPKLQWITFQFETTYSHNDDGTETRVCKTHLMDL